MAFSAWMASVILLSDLKKNELVQHPKGGLSFGEVPDFPKHGLVGGPIYLRKGEHRGNGGYGVMHIWGAHEYDLRKLGYLQPEDVAIYVDLIAQPGAPIYLQEHRQGNRRLSVLRSHTGILVLEPRHERPQQGGYGFYVVTAFPKRQAQGTLLGHMQKAP